MENSMEHEIETSGIWRLYIYIHIYIYIAEWENGSYDVIGLRKRRP